MGPYVSMPETCFGGRRRWSKKKKTSTTANATTATRKRRKGIIRRVPSRLFDRPFWTGLRLSLIALLTIPPSKDVNGKQVQISLTGFIEREKKGKFMKNLWTLHLSAQKNASGVPQWFLDAKEEETKKKKAEADQVAGEIERMKEKEVRELEKEKTRKMDGAFDDSNANVAGIEPNLKNAVAAGRSSHDEKEVNERNDLRRY
ncbi:PWI domain, partial [Dillenia turbinata]